MVAPPDMPTEVADSDVARLSAARADHRSAALYTPQICLLESKVKNYYVRP